MVFSRLVHMLRPKGYKSRLIDKKIAEYLSIFGAVCIEGPKWCGKTWSSLNQSDSVFYLADPTGNFSNREKVKIDPKFALDGPYPHLIDEWQEVPGIWDAVRFAVDQNGKKRTVFTYRICNAASKRCFS